jgi:structural maintenance of chromosome 2
MVYRYAEAYDRAAESAKLDDEMKKLATERQAQMGGDMKRLAAEVDTLSKSLVKDTATWTHKKDAVKAEKKSAEKLKKQAAQHEDQVAKEEARLSNLEEAHKASNNELKAAEAASEAAEITLQGVQSGSGAGGDGNKSLQTQLGDATAAASQADADAKAAVLKTKHAEKELASQNKAFAAKEKEGAKLTKELAAAEAAAEAAKAALANHPGAGSEQVAELEARRDSAEADVRAAQEKVDVLSGQLATLDFKFRDPEARFDRSRVKGVVAKLMQVKDPAMSTALEVGVVHSRPGVSDWSHVRPELDLGGRQITHNL